MGVLRKTDVGVMIIPRYREVLQGTDISLNHRNKAANLYRHPDALQDPTTSFTKQHDLYSLGVVMIEIACWKAMEDLFAHHKEFQGEECKEDDIQKIRGILLGNQGAQGNLNDVAFRTGSIYAKVVEVCLKGDFGADDGEELYESFQRRVIRELDRCVI